MHKAGEALMGRVAATFDMTDEVAEEMLKRGVRPYSGGGEYPSARAAFDAAREIADRIGFPVVARVMGVRRTYFPSGLRGVGYSGADRPKL